jgi:ABC-type nitrate/sulfonate/bicarbonate transport system substrate-binding protein
MTSNGMKPGWGWEGLMWRRVTAIACSALLLACGQPAAPSGPGPAAGSASGGSPPPAAAVAAAPTAAPTVAPTKVNVCIPSRSDTIMPASAALTGGYYQQANVEANILYFSGGQVDTAITAGQCDFIFGAGGVGPLLQGVDIVVVAATVNVSPGEVWGRAPIRTLADLKGRAIGTTGPGSLTWRTARYFLQANGLTPDEDVAVLSLGDSASTLGALLSGRVDAALMYSPDYFVAKREGLDLVYKPPSTLHMLNTALVTTKRYVAANRPVVVAMVKAITETLQRLKADEAFYATAREKFTDSTLDPADLREYWQAAVDVYVVPPRGTHDGAVTALALYADQTGGQDLDAIARGWLDMSIVDELYPPRSGS